MNAVPARVAGASRVVMCVPTPKGHINTLVLAAAKIAGVEEVYRVGGAQAVAAMAYGTEIIAAVDKIVGPGNAYVAEAKRQVFGHVGIDMIAGPSEILVVADAKNDARVTAIDLLSQAEHDETAQSILITDDGAFADAVCKAVDDHLETLASAKLARASWKDFGAVVVVGNLDEAPVLIDRLAPEHLMIATDDADALFDKVRHAGAVFLGRDTPEAIGDYVAGSNHVLPTGRSARFSSGLTIFEFLKRTSIVRAGKAGLEVLGPAAERLAEAEGLPAHARSVSIRLKGE
jgi:histidinol dehydrogenase